MVSTDKRRRDLAFSGRGCGPRWTLLVRAVMLLAGVCAARAGEHSLTNGLRVHVAENRSTTLVGISLRVRGGTACEAPGERGTFRLIPEVIRRGTENLRGGVEAWALDATVPPDRLRETLDLVTDLVFRARFAAEDVDKARGVVIQAMEREADAPLNHMTELYQSVFYPDFHAPRDKRIANIRGIGRDELAAIYRRFFRPDNAVLVIAGNVRDADALPAVQAILGPVPQPAVPLDRADIVQKETPLPARKDVSGGLTQSAVFVGTRLNAFDRKDEPVIKMLNAILASSVGGRLFKRVREEKGLVYSIGPSYSLGLPPYTWSVSATSRSRNVPDVIRETTAVLEDLKANPPSEEEIRRAREYLKTQLAISCQSPGSQSRTIALQMIRGEAVKTYAERLAEIESVSASHLTTFIQAQFPNTWTVLVLD
jgi:zinc protease